MDDVHYWESPGLEMGCSLVVADIPLQVYAVSNNLVQDARSPFLYLHLIFAFSWNILTSLWYYSYHSISITTIMSLAVFST